MVCSESLRSVITKFRKLAYKFIWDGKHFSSWAKMSLPRKDGGLGVRNFEVSARAIQMKRLHYFLTNPNSILPAWIRDRYIQRKPFLDLVSSPSRDSPMWQAILKHKNDMIPLMSCEEEYRLVPNRLNSGKSLQHFCQALFPWGQIDP